MEAEMKATVESVVTEVLESQVFLFAEPEAAPSLPALLEEGVCIDMTYSGPTEGAVWLALPRGMCVEITANALGIDENEAEELPDVVDAAKELLNVISGQLLTELYGEEPIFDLTPPVAITLGAAAWDERIYRPEAVCFSIDDLPLAVGFTARPANLEE